MSSDARVTRLLVWARISQTDPIADLAVFGCAFAEWYCETLFHLEHCEDCREANGEVLRQTLEAHHRIVTALLGATTLEEVRKALDEQADLAPLANMPTNATKH